jgi:hypothetical protein
MTFTCEATGPGRITSPRRILFSDQETLLGEVAVHEKAITNRSKGVTMARWSVLASFASAQVTGYGLPDVARHVIIWARQILLDTSSGAS